MKLTSRAASFLILPLLFSNVVFAVPLGYITGNRYLALPENERLHWFLGVMDGLMAEDFNSESSRASRKEKVGVGAGVDTDWYDLLWTARCAERYPIEQLKAIFEKELKENPSSWHAPAAYVARQKIYQICKD